MKKFSFCKCLKCRPTRPAGKTKTTRDSKAGGTTTASKPPDHAKFDESNIKATFHPVNKDYGFMKIDEAKTPFSDYKGEPEDAAGVVDSADSKVRNRRSSFVASTHEMVDSELLSQRLKDEAGASQSTEGQSGSGTKGNKAEDFESLRKAHYNEFKVAKELLQKDKGSSKDLEPSDDEKNKKTK
jgi:hypothetical protein